MKSASLLVLLIPSASLPHLAKNARYGVPPLVSG